MLTMFIIIAVLAIMLLCKAYQSWARVRMYKREHERRKEVYTEYQKVKRKLNRMTNRPRLANGRFVKR